VGPEMMAYVKAVRPPLNLIQAGEESKKKKTNLWEERVPLSFFAIFVICILFSYIIIID
jgi:hypothetical protein